jgi:hypothetical protein
LNGRCCCISCSITSTAWESRLMKDALTILVTHVSRQQGQSLLHVGRARSPVPGRSHIAPNGAGVCPRPWSGTP